MHLGFSELLVLKMYEGRLQKLFSLNIILIVNFSKFFLSTNLTQIGRYDHSTSSYIKYVHTELQIKNGSLWTISFYGDIFKQKVAFGN